MKTGLNIAFFGSSIVSAYWNGAATYYRGIVRALHERGHRITFYEPDAYGRQQHRDIEDPDWCDVVVYAGEGEDGVRRALDSARNADLIVKASGVGVFDKLLEAAVLELRRPGNTIAFWDVDAPATLDRVNTNIADPFRRCVPQYDFIFTYGGGAPVVDTYTRLGARQCVPIYNALDPAEHHRVERDARFDADLAFLGNRLPDREARVEEFFLEAAKWLPGHKFLLGGSGWSDKRIPQNVHYVGHVYTRDHNAFNCTPRAVLNISRQSMAAYGFSPATRVFEAAGAGACLITDFWEGIELFLEPGREVLVANNGQEVADVVKSLTPERAREIGDAACQRVLSEHTYAHRAEQLEKILCGNSPRECVTAAIPKHDEVSDEMSDIASERLRIVVLGLSITSSWGNGHATTYRGLMRELAQRGHDVLFLERDVTWYAANRDLPNPPYGRTELYTSLDDLKSRFAADVRNADAVIVGSYVPEGVAIGEWVTQLARGITAFYDIDTPVTLAKLERKDFEYLNPELIARYDLYLSFTGGPTLQTLENVYHSPAARALYCSVDPTLYYPENHGSAKWDLGYLGTYSIDRQTSLEQLLLKPARKIHTASMVVAGPQYPPYIAWPNNVERIEHLPPARHRIFYNQQRFTLNITRADMIRAGYSPSVRLFEAAACGTPIISDDWDGLSELLIPDEEILIAKNSSDVIAYLCEMRDSERLAIGTRARERVLAEHTSAHRARELEGILLETLARAA
jgi:spore maturation protein CgeB